MPVQAVPERIRGQPMFLLSERRTRTLKTWGDGLVRSNDLKGITGVGGNQLTAGRTVIVVRQVIVVVMFQFQVQMPTRWIVPLRPLLA